MAKTDHDIGNLEANIQAAREADSQVGKTGTQCRDVNLFSDVCTSSSQKYTTKSVHYVQKCTTTTVCCIQLL